MEPETISEKLMYTTVRLTTTDGKESGTGFFFIFKFDEDYTVPVLLTNKHVVRNNPNESMCFRLHIDTGKNGKYENISLKLDAHWLFHKNQDICCCFVNPLLEQIEQKVQKKVIFKAADESLIWTAQQLEELSAVEDVTMVGYPIGLSDERNNFPIFRRGYTASHPAIDFNRDGVGLVDIACFPGSSGSPIFIINESGYRDKKGNLIFGTSRVLLLGVLFEGPTMNIDGEVIVQNIPTQQKVLSRSENLINLGYYIKAQQLLEFKPIIGGLITKPKA